MGALDELEWFAADDRETWRRWLETHHDGEKGVWLVTNRKGSGRPILAYDDAVEEALAFGWVDSKGGKVNDERTRLLFSPRKRGSGWSRPNKQRIARLEASGRMAPAGRRIIESAKADGSWSLLDDVEDLVVPDDLAAAFDERPGSRDHWDGFPRSVRRGILEWITTAKRPETRARRVDETATAAAAGERANQ